MTLFSRRWGSAALAIALTAAAAVAAVSHKRGARPRGYRGGVRCKLHGCLANALE